MMNTQLWTALITPMYPDGSIHFADLEKMARRQEEAGNGILILGSTGEGLALSGDEKASVVEFVANLNLSVPVMTGVGGFQQKTQMDWIKLCNPLRIDAFLLVTPLYAKPGPVGLTEWFNALMDVSGHPCMVYNIPSRTGMKLPPSVLQKIERHERFWAVKESSGSINEYKTFRSVCPAVPFFSGDDGLLPVFAAEGCAGLVSVAANVWPKATKRYVEKCLAGESRQLSSAWDRAIKVLFSAPNPIPAKVLLHEKKLLETAMLRPPLTARELSSLAALKKADKEIMNWYEAEG